MAWTRWTLLVAILLLPTVTAASGTFHVEGGTQLPAGAQVRVAPAVVFLAEMPGMTAFDLTAGRAILHVFEQRSTDVGVGEASLIGLSPETPVHRQRPLTQAHVSLANVSEQGGFLGVYPGKTASARLDVSARTYVDSEDDRRLDTSMSTGDSAGSSDQAPLEPDPDFEFTGRGAHAWVDGPGTLRYDGPGFVKIVGPDVLLTSANRTERISTGYERVAPHERVLRWVVVELEAGSFEAAASTPWNVAAPSASAAWQGETIFRPSSGVMESAGGEYVATEGTVRLSGRFDADFTPNRQDGRLLTRMTISGDVSETNLHLASTLAGRLLGEGGVSLPALLVVAAAVAGAGAFGAGAWLAWRPRRAHGPAEPRLPYTVEECMAAATAAADDEDWPRAIHWLERVRALAPTSSRTSADLAHAFHQLGRADEALRTYEEASRLSGDGEADFNGAVVAVEAGRPAEEVETWLERTLARTPAYVFDVESDPAFAALRGRPRFERIVTDAWMRVDDADFPGA